MELLDLSSTTSDYANWDDTYAFIQDRNEGYVESNLVPETFVDTRSDLIVLLNFSGDIVYAGAHDADLNQEMAFPDELIDHLGTDGVILSTTSEERTLSGIVQLTNGRLIVSASPILMSDRSGPTMGTLLMGRWLDTSELDIIAASTSLSLSMYSPDDLVIYSWLGDGGMTELNLTGMAVVPETSETVAGYHLFTDIYGSKAVVLKAEIPRNIYNQGQTSSLYLVASVAIVGLMFGLVTMALLERSIISRLSALDSEVSHISSKQDPSGSVTVAGDDEISALAKSINVLLSTVDSTKSKLQESESRYKAVVEQQMESICRFGPDFRITFANEAFCKNLNERKAMVIGSSFVSYLPDADVPGVKERSLYLTPEHPTTTYEYSIIAADGVRWQRATQTAIFEQDGRIAEFQLVGRDITEEKKTGKELKKYREHLEELVKERTLELEKTNKELEAEIAERRRAEAGLYDSERRYRAVVEDQTELILRYRSDGTVTFANTAFCKFFERRPEEIVGRVFVPEMSEEDRELLRRSASLLSIDQPVLSTQVRVKNSRGQASWLLWTHRGIFDDGGLVEIQSVGRDVTDRMKMMDEILKVQKLESIGLLAGGIAHDFNNVLTAILNNVTLVRLQLPPDNYTNTRLREAEKEIMMAKNLTHQLLTFSKGGEPVKEVASIPELVTSATKLALGGSNAVYRLSFAEDLRNVEVDKGQIAQVANNLILNAYQAMPNGGVVSISARNTIVGPNRSPHLREGEYVEISFTDTGVGIPKENLGRIFDPFFTTKEKGNGLGLSSALSIIRKHGGHIEVESEIGKGSSFRVYLPASRMTEEGREKVEEPTGDGDGSVLLMDDDEDILDVIGEILRTTGYHVEIAHNGEEAVKRYKEAMENGRPFDVVIMDLTIRGGMGGKDAITELLRIDPAVKAIVSSGYSNDPVMADFRRFGFVGVLQKPYSLAYLAKAIRDVVEKR